LQTRIFMVVAVVILAASVLPLFWADGTTSTPPDRLPYLDAAAVAAGKVIYSENCAACHGAELQGDPDWQSLDEDGLMRPPPHNGDGHTWHHDDKTLFTLTKFGTAAYVGDGYKSNMIGYSEILSDSEIRQVLAYIKSTWPQETIDIHNEINASSDLAN